MVCSYDAHVLIVRPEYIENVSLFVMLKFDYNKKCFIFSLNCGSGLFLTDYTIII